MKEYLREGRVWKFNPLPPNNDAASLFLAMAEISKNQKTPGKLDQTVLMNMISSLPRCIQKSMGKHHTEDEVNEFIDTIELDFGNPEKLMVVADLHQLFMGLDPAKPKPDAVVTVD